MVLATCRLPVSSLGQSCIEYCLEPNSWLPCDCFATAMWLSCNSLATASVLVCNCPTTAWPVFDKCLTSARQLEKSSLCKRRQHKRSISSLCESAKKHKLVNNLFFKMFLFQGFQSWSSQNSCQSRSGTWWRMFWPDCCFAQEYLSFHSYCFQLPGM